MAMASLGGRFLPPTIPSHSLTHLQQFNAKTKLRHGLQSMQCSSWGSRNLEPSRDDRQSNNDDEKQPDAGDIAKQLEGFLQSDESKALLDELDEAVRRVERARKELQSLDDPKRRDEEMAAAVEQRIRDELVDQQAVIEECEEELSAAKAEAKAAQATLVALRAGLLDEPNNRELERLESVKAAAVASLAGAFSSFPFLLADYSLGSKSIGSLVVSEAGILLSCAVYGVCYRYIVRRDLENVQLKSGSVAAFALTRGLGLLDAVQVELPPKDWLLLAAVYCGQSAAVFLSAAVALDLCLQSQVIKPFPSQGK